MKRKLFFMAMVALIATTFTSCKKKDNNIVVGEAVYEELLTGNLYSADGATVYLMTSSGYVEKTTAASDGSFQFDPAPDGEYWIDVVYSTTLYDYEGNSSKFFIEKEDYKDVGRIICY